MKPIILNYDQLYLMLVKDTWIHSAWYKQWQQHKSVVTGDATLPFKRYLERFGGIEWGGAGNSTGIGIAPLYEVWNEYDMEYMDYDENLAF